MVYFGGFFPQAGIFAGFSLHIINFAVRSSEAAMGRGHYIVQGSCSSFRVRRSSVGCSLSQKAVAQLRRVQRSSERFSVAQKVAA